MFIMTANSLPHLLNEPVTQTGGLSRAATQQTCCSINTLEQLSYSRTISHQLHSCCVIHTLTLHCLSEERVGGGEGVVGTTASTLIRLPPERVNCNSWFRPVGGSPSAHGEFKYFWPESVCSSFMAEVTVGQYNRHRGSLLWFWTMWGVWTCRTHQWSLIALCLVCTMNRVSYCLCCRYLLYSCLLPCNPFMDSCYFSEQLLSCCSAWLVGGWRWWSTVENYVSTTRKQLLKSYNTCFTLCANLFMFWTFINMLKPQVNWTWHSSSKPTCLKCNNYIYS